MGLQKETGVPAHSGNLTTPPGRFPQGVSTYLACPACRFLVDSDGTHEKETGLLRSFRILVTPRAGSQKGCQHTPSEDGILEWPCERPHGEKTKKVYHHDWKEHEQQSEARKGGRSTGTGPISLDGTLCKDVPSGHGVARSTGVATAVVASPE